MTEKSRNGTIKPGRLLLYSCIAIIAILLAIYALLQGPEPGFPINLIHLLFKR